MLTTSTAQRQTVTTAGVARARTRLTAVAAAPTAAVTAPAYRATCEATALIGTGIGLGSWSAFSGKSMNVPAFHDPWPL